MKLLLVALAIFGIASSLPMNESQDIAVRNDAGALESLIREALELIRDLIINGSEDIPVLDPLVIEHLEIGEPGLLHLIVDDLVVNQLSTFVVPHLNVRSISTFPITRFGFTFYGNIPSVDIAVGHYDLDIAVAGATFFGKGAARMSFIEPRLEGEIEIRGGVLTGITLQRSDVRFHMTGFKSDIRGLLGDESVSDFLNTLFEHLVPDLIEFYKDEISSVINEVILEVGNSLLNPDTLMMLGLKQ